MVSSIWRGVNQSLSQMIPLLMQKKRDEEELSMKQQLLDRKDQELRAEAAERASEFKRKADEAKTKLLMEDYKMKYEARDKEGIAGPASGLESMGFPVGKREGSSSELDMPGIPNIKYLVKPEGEEKRFTTLESFLANQPGLTPEKAIKFKKGLTDKNPNFKTFYDKTGNPNTIDTIKQTPDPTWSEDKPDKKTTPTTTIAAAIQTLNPEAPDYLDQLKKLTKEFEAAKNEGSGKGDEDAKKNLTRLEDDIMQTIGRVENLRAGVNIASEAMGSERTTSIANLESQLETMKKQYSELGGKRKFEAEQKKAADEMAEMPPAAEHKGKVIKDTKTGKRYKSDGKAWVEVK